MKNEDDGGDVSDASSGRVMTAIDYSTKGQNGLTGDTMTAKKTTKDGFLQRVLRETLIPLTLMIVVPNFVVALTFLVVHKGGNVHSVIEQGIANFWCDAWKESAPFDTNVWITVIGFFIWATLSLLCLGGKKYQGPPTQNGFCPVYVRSGLRYYVLTVTLMSSALICPNLITAWYWYKKGSVLAGTLVSFGLIFSCFLWVKGLIAPSPGEHGSSGNPIFDFYWGRELYPRIGRWLDLKMLSNCRFGMMAWQLIVLISFKAQLEHTGWNWAMLATTILQTVYIAKFFWWEDGYMKSIDIILDRAGFYICWGCICLVPTFYTLTSVYSVENSPSMSPSRFIIILCFGLGSVALNYWTDYQRQLARSSGGKCVIWNKPARVIRAIYLDDRGHRKTNVILASGFWSLSRHINYVFELGAAFTWALPSGFDSLLPYSYFIFLFILLLHRSFRDDKKCREKYGKDWDEYCRIAKYRMLPGIF